LQANATASDKLLFMRSFSFDLISVLHNFLYKLL
jgi:hypothetical protein